MNVLIADDNMEYIKNVINCIISQNDKIRIVGIANDGYEVLSKVFEENIELLILDLKMPNCSGIEVINEIVKMNLPKLPIIFVLTGEIEMLNKLTNKDVVVYIANKTDGIDNIMYKINEIVRCNDNNSSQIENKIIEELIDNKFEQVLLTGGEPLLNRNIYLIMDKLIEKNIDVSISTNGMLLLDNINELKKRKIKKVIVSLDTLDDNLYKKLRGKNTDLFKVLKGIEEVKNNTNIFITAHCVVNKLNIDEVPEILDYANRNSIEFTISNLIPIDNKNIDCMVCTIEEIMNMLENNGILLKKINYDCGACRKVVGIKTDGTFTPCLWISNYTNQYDTYNLCDLERESIGKEENGNTCVAMNFNKILKNEKSSIRTLTVQLN